MALIESRGLPRVTSSPGPLKFESSIEASSFLTQSYSKQKLEEEEEKRKDHLRSEKQGDSH